MIFETSCGEWAGGQAPHLSHGHRPSFWMNNGLEGQNRWQAIVMPKASKVTQSALEVTQVYKISFRIKRHPHEHDGV